MKDAERPNERRCELTVRCSLSLAGIADLEVLRTRWKLGSSGEIIRHALRVAANGPTAEEIADAEIDLRAYQAADRLHWILPFELSTEAAAERAHLRGILHREGFRIQEECRSAVRTFYPAGAGDSVRGRVIELALAGFAFTEPGRTPGRSEVVRSPGYAFSRADVDDFILQRLSTVLGLELADLAARVRAVWASSARVASAIHGCDPWGRGLADHLHSLDD